MAKRRSTWPDNYLRKRLMTCVIVMEEFVTGD
jgi:hypothetical protein